MAEPALQLDTDDDSQDSRTRPELVHSGERSGPTHTGQLSSVPDKVYDEGGTEPSSPSRSHLRAVENGEGKNPIKNEAEDKPSRDELAEKENNAAGAEPKHEGLIGTGYHQGDQHFGRFSIKGRLSRRKALFGGGIIGTIVAILMFFSFLGGPFEFLHLAQLMEKFHFASLQNQQNDRFMKEVRFWRYASKGEIERTRMTVLGNKFSDKFETRMNTSGLSSAYTDKFGLLDGYVIDRENDNFKGLSDEEFKAKVQQLYGVEPVLGSEIKGSSTDIKKNWVIDASSLKIRDTYQLNYGVLRQAGYNKLSAAIGARMFCVRAGCNWHPLYKLSGNIKRALEEWTQKNVEAEEKGVQEVAVEDSSTSAKQNDPGATDQQTAVGSEKDIADASKGAGSDPAKLASLENLIHSKLTQGGALAIGALCIIYGINKEAVTLKQVQVILPLIRMGVESMSIGSEVESGSQDIDTRELGQIHKQMVGIDSTGKKTSAFDAESINANLGRQNTGVAPSTTLTSINKGGPFDDFLSHIPGIGTVCSTAGQIFAGILQIAIDATGIGAVIAQLISGLAQGVVLSIVSGQAAQYLAGKAIDVANLFGADFGSATDFGAALAANAQSVSAGGRALSNQESGTLSAINTAQDRKEFSQHNIAYRLFNPNDVNSAVSKVIDKGTPDVSQNVAKVSSYLVNFKSSFASIGSIFTGRSLADTGAYNYGFPAYGFSEAEMDSPLVHNPYENACYVVGCPQRKIQGLLTDASGDNISSTGQAIIDQAQKCFGVSIAQDHSGSWDVTASSTDPNDLPNPYDSKYKGNSCDNLSPDWLRVRFFIMDTEVMNSMSCYEGDGQACSDIGFASTPDASTAAPSTGSTSTATIDMANIFKESTSVSCAANTKDLGIQDGYHDGQLVKIRICAVSNLPSTSEESNGGYGVTGADGKVVVNSRVSGAVYAMVAAAAQDGVTLTASSGFRTMAHQQALFAADPNPDLVAVPGTSNHQMGLAIDFQGLPSTPGPVPGNQFWEWLSAKAINFGFQNYPREAWHWSVTGN